MIYLRNHLEHCRGCDGGFETHVGCLNFQLHLCNTVFKLSEPPQQKITCISSRGSQDSAFVIQSLFNT